MKTIQPVARPATTRARLTAGAAFPAPRAVLSTPRADVNNPAAVLADLQQTFAAFRAANDERLAALERGRGDVLNEERVERINSAVGALQTSMDEINRRVAAAQLNGSGGGAGQSAEVRAHAQGFETWFRTGEGEGQLNALAVQASLSRGSDPDGGYLAPTEMDTVITRTLENVSAVRRLAQVRSISGQSFKKPVSTGGASSGWAGETSARTETNSPVLKVLDFPAMELYANPAATQQLLDDSSVDIAQWLADEVAIEFAEEEGLAFVSGNGVNQPRGILSYDVVADASYAWGSLGFVISGEAADFKPASTTASPADAFVDAQYALKAGYRANASWLANRKTVAKMRKFKDADGNLIWQPSVQLGTPSTFLGHPVVDDDNMPDVGAGTFPVAFGDFNRGYLIVDRMGVRVLRDPYTNKPFVHFYTTKRVGGGIQNFEAIKLLKIAAS